MIASLNGVTPSGWISHARELEQAGADALELNVYYVAADIAQTGAQVEERYLEPAAGAAGPHPDPHQHEALPSLQLHRQPGHPDGRRRGQRGGTVQPLLPAGHQHRQPAPAAQPAPLHLRRGPARHALDRPPLRPHRGLSLGATGGVHTPEDAIKLLLAGADVVHLCSALLAKGPAYLRPSSSRASPTGWRSRASSPSPTSGAG